MGSIAEKLEYLNETKTQIKTALTNKGITIADTDTFRSYADKIANLKTTPTLQAKSQTITTNTTTTITPDSGYDGLSQVSITTNVAGGTLSVPAITLTNDSNLSKSVTLNANKTGVLVFHYASALHWYYKISVAGTKIVERRGTSDVGTINYVASGWTSRNIIKYPTGTDVEVTDILLIPASSSARTIAMEASSQYGGRFSWYTLIQ